MQSVFMTPYGGKELNAYRLISAFMDRAVIGMTKLAYIMVTSLVLFYVDLHLRVMCTRGHEHSVTRRLAITMA